MFLFSDHRALCPSLVGARTRAELSPVGSSAHLTCSQQDSLVKSVSLPRWRKSLMPKLWLVVKQKMMLVLDS